MREFSKNYLNGLIENIKSAQLFDQAGKPMDLFTGIESISHEILTRSQNGNKLLFIGNGASASIASHMSTDFWKNGGVRAMAFNDSSLLTCISNDYGYKHVFEKPIEMFAGKGDILIAISSSGKSENILRGAQAAKNAQCKVITFSGFGNDNPLISMGDYNFYIGSPSYGPVEIIHLALCHCICDAIIQLKSESSIE